MPYIHYFVPVIPINIIFVCYLCPVIKLKKERVLSLHIFPALKLSGTLPTSPFFNFFASVEVRNVFSILSSVSGMLCIVLKSSLDLLINTHFMCFRKIVALLLR